MKAILSLCLARLRLWPLRSRPLPPRRRSPGTVGPGFTISMATKPTKAGKIKLVVVDKSSIHNFHLATRRARTSPASM